LELAATRLHAFFREAGGARLDAVQSMLVLEILIALCRALLFVVDPVWSTGVFPLVGSFALVSYPNALASLSSLLFYVYFARAARVAGVKQLVGNATAGVDRKLIVSAAVGTHVVEAASVVLLSVACGMSARVFAMSATTVAYALRAVLLSAHAHALATESLLNLPNGILARLNAKLSASMGLLKMTALHRASYAELLVGNGRAQAGSAGPAAVGAATLFVSHAQAQPFRSLLAAIEAHFVNHGLDARQEFVWIDMCC
jgi:hypothetical protein